MQCTNCYTIKTIMQLCYNISIPISVSGTLRFIINGGVKINGGGGLQGYWKINKRGVKISGGVGTKYKRKETKIGLSL